jgi:hypothetical protein
MEILGQFSPEIDRRSASLVSIKTPAMLFDISSFKRLTVNSDSPRYAES